MCYQVKIISQHFYKINEIVFRFFSLFDNAIERYDKLRESAQRSSISQIGLAIFTQDRNSLNYDVETYNFYLCPQSCGSQDKRFLCQASSFEFLARHNFDFNKVISYVVFVFIWRPGSNKYEESNHSKNL